MLLDTSVLIAAFRSRDTAGRVEKEIVGEQQFVSMVQLAEVADWARRVGAPAAERVGAVELIARIAQVTPDICLDAAAIKGERRRAGFSRFGIVDGVILATARSLGQKLLTFDRDFEGEADCVVLR